MKPPSEERMTFIETPDNPVPPGGRVHWFSGHEGVRLRAGLWPAPGDGTRGTIFLMPGKSEFIEKYFEVIGELQARGYGVVCIDWRGQGLSHRDIDHPLKAHIVRFEDFFHDFEALYHGVASDFPQPHLMLAHSMGGNIALRIAAEHELPIKALILSAPMTGIRLSKAVKAFAGGIGKVMQTIGKAEEFVKGGDTYDPVAARFEDCKVTRDSRRFDRGQNILKAHPEIAQGSATFGWLHEAVKSTNRLFKKGYVQKIDVPVLLCLALADQLVDVTTTEKLADLLPLCRLEEFPDTEHEILMERDEIRDKFWRAFDAFINSLEPSAT